MISKAEEKYYERLEIEGVPPIFANYVNELKEQNRKMKILLKKIKLEKEKGILMYNFEDIEDIINE